MKMTLITPFSLTRIIDTTEEFGLEIDRTRYHLKGTPKQKCHKTRTGRHIVGVLAGQNLDVCGVWSFSYLSSQIL
jgi:hypothetical protein